MGEDYLRFKDILYSVKSERCRDFESQQLRLGHDVATIARAEVTGELSQPIATGELVVLTFPEPGTALLHQGRRVVGHLALQAVDAALLFADGSTALAATVAHTASPEMDCRVILFKKRVQ